MMSTRRDSKSKTERSCKAKLRKEAKRRQKCLKRAERLTAVRSDVFENSPIGDTSQ